MSIFGVILVRIFPYLDRIRTDSPCLRIQSKCWKTQTRKTPNTDHGKKDEQQKTISWKNINQPTLWMLNFVLPENQETCLKVVKSNQMQRLDRKYTICDSISKSFIKETAVREIKPCHRKIFDPVSFSPTGKTNAKGLIPKRFQKEAELNFLNLLKENWHCHFLSLNLTNHLQITLTLSWRGTFII